MKELHIYGSPERLGEFMADENARKVLLVVDAMHCHFDADAKTPSAKEALDAIESVSGPHRQKTGTKRT